MGRWMLLAGALAGCATQAPVTMTGTWTGLLGEDSMHKVGIRFVIEDDAGVLRGQTYFQDQGTDAYAIEADVMGTRSGDNVQWISSTGVEVRGVVDGGVFVGTLRFPPDEGMTDRAGKLVLSRQP